MPEEGSMKKPQKSKAVASGGFGSGFARPQARTENIVKIATKPSSLLGASKAPAKPKGR